MSSATDIQKGLQKDAIAQIANVSAQLREAIAASIPVAPDQYMTIAVPGSVIDIRDAAHGGTLIYDATQAFVPTSVRQEEARLVDKMLPLANVMVGNTGKSVARSYSRALDGLVPRKASLNSGVNEIRSPGEKTYDDAMKYLTTIDPKTGLTPVDTYVEKQKLWANAQEEWDAAKVEAKKAAETNPDNATDGQVDSAKVLQQYNDWNQANYRKYKFAVQGQWMDWVTNGNKYNVEYNFGLVDVDSIMARVENSKESMRNSTMVDYDGANELQGVNLTPRDWATKCKAKADGWYARNGSYTVEQIDAEILRLERLKISYNALASKAEADPQTFPIQGPVEPTGTGVQDADLGTKFQALYAAHAAYNLEIERIRADPSKRDDIMKSDDFKSKKAALKAAQADVEQTVDGNREYHAQLTKYQTASLTGSAKESLNSTIDLQIQSLNDKRASKLGSFPITLPVIADASVEDDEEEGATDLAPPGAELADDMFMLPPPTEGTGVPASGSVSDPWTTITASFSASSQTSSSDTSSWGFSVGGGAGWGLWSVGGSYAHDQSQSNSVSDIANCDVSVTFSAMVVNIDRPWLYTELFNDFELEVADHILLSPGAMNLKTMMTDQATPAVDAASTAKANNAIAYLAQYNSFPAFPTSFILAADTSIEFTGNTAHIEDHFNSHSNSGSTSVGWGPFHVSSSFHESASQELHQLQTTATGCKLTFGAPQIIGWVSQIIPELPRSRNYEPMVQNLVPGIPRPVPPTIPI